MAMETGAGQLVLRTPHLAVTRAITSPQEAATSLPGS